MWQPCQWQVLGCQRAKWKAKVHSLGMRCCPELKQGSQRRQWTWHRCCESNLCWAWLCHQIWNPGQPLGSSLFILLFTAGCPFPATGHWAFSSFLNWLSSFKHPRSGVWSSAIPTACLWHVHQDQWRSQCWIESQVLGQARFCMAICQPVQNSLEGAPLSVVGPIDEAWSCWSLARGISIFPWQVEKTQGWRLIGKKSIQGFRI